MKKLTFIFVFILLSINISAQEWVKVNSNKPSSHNVELLSETIEEITMVFQLGGYCINNVETPRGVSTVITAPKMASLLMEGAPDLPLFAIPVAIGDKAEMKVEVSGVQFEEYQDIDIAPSKGNFSREIDPETVP